MIQFRETLRRATVLAAASLVLSLGGPAAAQDEDAEVQARIEAALAAAVDTRPIAPAQLVLSARFVKTTGMEAKLDETLPWLLDPMRDEILANLPAATTSANKAVAVAALQNALPELKADLRHKLATALTRYYAVSLRAEALEELSAYNTSPLGQKSLRDPYALSAAERQAVGAYSLAHPAMSELGPVLPGSLKVTETIVTREKGVVAATLRLRMCDALKARGAAPASCASAG